MKDFTYKKHPIKHAIIICALSAAVIISMNLLIIKGKNHVDFKAIAVSADERYIACFETGSGQPRILCFSADGTLVYVFEVIDEFSAGGHCALWFMNENLYVQFYRTNKIIQVSTDGILLDITKSNTNETPNAFPSFKKEGHQYIYSGNHIDVIYEKASFVGYYFFNTPRYLAITPKGENLNIVHQWSA